MTVHDWTRVSAGTFHDFHNAWITEPRNALNGGLLPPGFYAQGEQHVGQVQTDVLTLHAAPEAAAIAVGGVVVLEEAAPRVSTFRNVLACTADWRTITKRSLSIP